MKAVKENFPNSKVFICSWHTSNNFKKHFLYLNRKKGNEAKELYSKIINLPYCEYVEDYQEIYDEIVSNEYLSEDSKSYLKKKDEYCALWVKAYMKSTFTGGTCTTSRIESKHRILKQYLNSQSNLQEVFQVFANIETTEIKNYIDEVIRFKNNEEENFLKSDLLKELERIYSPYAMNRVKTNFLVASNYEVDIIKRNTEW